MKTEIHFFKSANDKIVVETLYQPMINSHLEFAGRDYKIVNEKTVIDQDGDVIFQYTAIIPS